MSTVIPLFQLQGQSAVGFGPDALVHSVSLGRRQVDDLRWLKENAELLRVLVAGGEHVSQTALEHCYGEFLAKVQDKLAFFPQYYRFFLHIACDLAALGLTGPNLGSLLQIAIKSGFPQAELSDLQRAESHWLMRRCGHDPGQQAEHVADRLHAFAASPRPFALPNRKAAYELTHIAFYLTDFGTKPMQSVPELAASLHNVGIVAWLEQNLDLQAECAIALRAIGSDVPAIWIDRLSAAIPAFRFSDFQASVGVDAFHGWLMCLWNSLAQGHRVLNRPFPNAGFQISAPRLVTGTMRKLSIHLHQLAPQGAKGWLELRSSIMEGLEEEEAAILNAVADATPDFEQFFEDFSRVGLRTCVA